MIAELQEVWKMVEWVVEAVLMTIGMIALVVAGLMTWVIVGIVQERRKMAKRIEEVLR